MKKVNPKIEYGMVVGDAVVVVENINKALNDGWELFGAPFRVQESFTTDMYKQTFTYSIAQAMTRKVKVSK